MVTVVSQLLLCGRFGFFLSLDSQPKLQLSLSQILQTKRDFFFLQIQAFQNDWHDFKGYNSCIYEPCINFALIKRQRNFQSLDSFHVMDGSPGELSEELVTQEKRKKGWIMNCDVGEATEGLENEL